MTEVDGLVLDARGVRGRIEESGGDGEVRVRVLLDDGRRLRLPPLELSRRSDGALFFHGSFDELADAARDERGGALDGARSRAEVPFAVVPVVEEELRVGKRVVETGRVRVTKTVGEREEVVDEPLLREEFEVERVPVDAYVEGPVAPWHEGETLVIPVLEEVLVVEKRLVVREEIRITRRRTEEHNPQRVTLRSEEVLVERAGPDEGAGAEEAKGRHA